MTSKEFVIWMRGFMEACNDYTATPKQWDRIKEELEKVNDNDIVRGIGSTGFLNIPNLNSSTTYVNAQSGSWHYTNS